MSRWTFLRKNEIKGKFMISPLLYKSRGIFVFLSSTKWLSWDYLPAELFWVTVFTWRGLRAHGLSKQKKTDDFKFLRKPSPLRKKLQILTEENFPISSIFSHFSFLQHFDTKEIELKYKKLKITSSCKLLLTQ